MQMTAINVRSYNVAGLAIDPSQITAEGGPRCPRLVINLTIRPMSTPPWAVDRKIMNVIGAQYELRGAQNRLFAEGSVWAARELYPDYDLVLPLSFSLDPQRVREIDEYRGRKDLDLLLVVTIILGLPPETSPAEIQTSNRSLLSELAPIPPAQIRFQIPRSTWMETILPQLREPTYELVELPLRRGRISEAVDYLKAAEAAYDRWDTKSVCVHCREMATALDNAIKLALSSDKFTVEERWGRAFERFNNLASLDLHLEDIKKKSSLDASQVHIERYDAEFVLLSAKTLITYAAHLLPE